MLDNKSIKEFVAQLGEVIQSLISTAKTNEHWPQDEHPDVYKEIESLSSALIAYQSSEGDLSLLPKEQCIAAMSLLQYDRSLAFLKSYISSDDVDLNKLLQVQDGADSESVNYTIIMLNRLVLLARVNVLNQVFSKRRVHAIREALAHTDIQ